MKTIKFIFHSETSGAWRYQELDAAGNKLDLGNSHIGTLYMRKAKMPQKKEFIEIEVKD